DAHGSFDELERLLRSRFVDRAQKIGLPAAVQEHFRVHCLKHDLEVLLLACPERLRERLGTRDALQGRWRKPVEEQNDQQPPKRIVEGLFNRYRKRRYADTVDAPWILSRASLEEVVALCAQRFRPFVDELRRLAQGGTLP